MATLSKVSCGHCSLDFEPSKHKKSQKFCSDKCRKASYYQEHKDYYAKKFKQQYRDRADKLNAIKTENGCCKCGYNAHPAALDFNHIDPKTKSGNIADKIMHWSMEKLLEEVDKCEVLCSNCHRIHSYETHYTRMGTT